MLLPLGIEHPYERTPYATYALIGACVACFGLQMSQEGGLIEAALYPTDLDPVRLVTHAFLHGDLLHLLGNMWMLWVYGRYAEDRLGPARFALLYLGGAIAGGLAYAAGGSPLPAVGASGAISALFGLVLVVAPWCQVVVRVFLHIFPVGDEFHMAAFWLLVPWIALELLSVPGHEESQIAVLGHVGGFMAGAALGVWCRQPARRGSGWWLDPAPPGGGAAARRRLANARSRPVGRTTPPATPGSNPDVAVVLTSLPASVSRVAVVKLLMVHAGLEPEEAMTRLQRDTDRDPLEIPVPSRESASSLLAGLEALGAQAHVRLPAARARSTG